MTLGTATASVTLSSIPATYRDLVLIENVKHESLSGGQSSRLRFNGDTGSNYTMVYLAGNTGTNSGQSGTDSTTFAYAGRFNNTDGNNGITQIMDYSATDKHKTVLSRGNLNANGLAIFIFANRWANTAAITSLVLSPEGGGNYATGSTFALYGIAS